MGKQIIQQRRGRGTTTYRVPEKSFKPNIIYRNLHGKVVDIVANPIADAPLVSISYDDNTIGYLVAPQGVKVGDTTDFVKTLAEIPEGTTVFGLETFPNSGPKLCRSPGKSALIVSKSGSEVVVELPSKKQKKLNSKCRACIGVPAGEGRRDMPFVKAGNVHYLTRARGKLYPITSAKRMNAVDHPFGGSGSGKRKPPVSRDAPPGAKVGTFASRRTGRRKK